MANPSGGWLTRLGNLLVPPSQHDSFSEEVVTNTRILDELVASFDDSIRRESVGSSLLFNAHYLIILHPDTYERRQNAFPVIVDEAIGAFRRVIDAHKGDYGRLAPVASSWYFKFGAGQAFDDEVIAPTDVRVIGALTGILPGNPPVPLANNVNVTRRVKLTNRYEKVDIDLNAFRHIDFREPGAFVVKFGFDSPKPVDAPRPVSATVPANTPVTRASSLPWSADEGLARIQYYIAEQNKDATYVMRDGEIVVARQEPDNQDFPNYLRLESPYVSNPHARIRYHEATQSFQIASFSRNETRVNERLIPRSEPASPQWHELPANAQILLNSMVTLTFQPNR